VSDLGLASELNAGGCWLMWLAVSWYGIINQSINQIDFIPRRRPYVINKSCGLVYGKLVTGSKFHVVEIDLW